MAKYAIEWGLHEMADLWADLTGKADTDTLHGDELRLFKKLVKTASFLEENPKHPGLASHEIEALSERYGQKVLQSYLENKKPAAARLFWVYGPEKDIITIIGLEPHPESGKSRGYERVRLSTMRAVKDDKDAKATQAAPIKKADKKRQNR